MHLNYCHKDRNNDRHIAHIMILEVAGQIRQGIDLFENLPEIVVKSKSKN